MQTCKQCGTCCRNGGPALHREDRFLLEEGHLPITALITIRRGEPVYSPLSDTIEPARHEFLKLGSQDSWTCPYLDLKTNQCTTYKFRPLECGLLKCWDTNDLLQCVYKDLLTRWELIPASSSILPLLKRHEQECDYAQLNELQEKMDQQPTDILEYEMQALLQRDGLLREQAIKQFGLSLAQELFYFGRPMFKAIESKDK